MSPQQIKALRMAKNNIDFSGKIHANTIAVLIRKEMIESLGSGYYEITDKGRNALILL